MKKIKFLSLALAVVALVGLYACNNATKETKEVETEVVTEEEVPVTDTVAIEAEVVDSTAVEATEEVEEEAEETTEE